MSRSVDRDGCEASGMIGAELFATHTHIKIYQIQAPLVEGNTDLQKFTKIYKSGEIYGNSVVTDFSKIFNRHR